MSYPFSIAKALGGGKKGNDYFGKCPCHADRTPSLKISSRYDGDIDVHCFAGCDWRDVKDKLRDMGLLPDWQEGQSAWTPERQAEIDQKRKEAERQAQADLEARINEARQIWANTKEVKDTPVEAYLRARGINLSVPASLRYAPNLYHNSTGLAFPTMIAGVCHYPSNKVTAIHRTYLKADGSDKAPVSGNKLGLGPWGGGAVWLRPVGSKLVIGEGIETTLSVMQETGLPGWAALNAGNMKKQINLPPVVKEVIIAADNDRNGIGQDAAFFLQEALLRKGLTVKVMLPPQAGDDWNDILMGLKQ